MSTESRVDKERIDLITLLDIFLKKNFEKKKGFCTDCWARGMREVFLISDSKVCLDCVIDRILNQKKTEKPSLALILEEMKKREEAAREKTIREEAVKEETVEAEEQAVEEEIVKDEAVAEEVVEAEEEAVEEETMEDEKEAAAEETVEEEPVEEGEDHVVESIEGT